MSYVKDKLKLKQVQWCVPVIPAFRRLKQEEHWTFKVSLVYKVNPS